MSVDKGITRKDFLVSLFAKLNFFYRDVDLLIIEYDDQREWKGRTSAIWTECENPTAIISYQQNIYVATYRNESLLMCFNTNGKVLKQLNLGNRWIRSIDVDEKTGLLYIATRNSISTQSLLNFHHYTHWHIPVASSLGPGKVKVNNGICYLSMPDKNQVLLCQLENGELLEKIGTGQGQEKGQFDRPLGMTLNNKCLYVCDSWNQRIQIFDKKSRKFSHQWGENNIKQQRFFLPISIYYHHDENTFFVGECYSVQIFTEDGTFIQQIRGWENEKDLFNEIDDSCIIGTDLCVLHDQLYVVDRRNDRIRIFNKS